MASEVYDDIVGRAALMASSSVLFIASAPAPVAFAVSATWAIMTVKIARRARQGFDADVVRRVLTGVIVGGCGCWYGLQMVMDILGEVELPVVVAVVMASALNGILTIRVAEVVIELLERSAFESTDWNYIEGRIRDVIRPWPHRGEIETVRRIAGRFRSGPPAEWW